VSADLLQAGYGSGCCFGADFQQGQQELCQQITLLKEISHLLNLQRKKIAIY
jgi:hypothetical protein